MRKHVGKLLTTTGVVAAAIGLSATTALATSATTWTINPGGALSGSTTKTTLTDTKSGAVLTCTASTASGTAKSGSGLTNPLATISNITFSNCTGPAGLQFTVSTSGFPWKLNGLSYSSGKTTGNVTGIHAHLHGTNLTCEADIAGSTATKSGTVKVTHKNGTAGNKLTVITSGSTLHAYNVNGCLGAVNNNDPLTYAATYTLSKSQTITSP